jgi:NDP-sugar pyrophosphorylase family protein
MKAFILAGGFGSRLREVVHGRPKVLATVAGRPFLEHVLRYLKGQGVEDIVLGVGYLAHFVESAFGNGRELGLNIEYSHEERPLGTAGAIKKAAKLLSQDFFVLNGDTYLDLDLNKLREFHLEHEADVTITMTKTDYGRGGLVKATRAKEVIKFEGTPERRPRGWYNNAGVYIFNRKILRLLRPHEKCSLERHLFPMLLEQDFRVFGYATSGDYLDIGSTEHYNRAKKIFQALHEDS